MSRRSPIIVVGKNRSGTKWLSNLLANHSRVAAVQSELHNGVLETNFFGVMQETFGDVRRVENYIAMVEAWAHTDFFKASGCDKTLLYTSRPRPRSYAEVFDLIMEDMARREGASHWLQKTSPLQAESVVDSFPRCRVVVITRELIPTLESSITLARTLGTDASAARATFRFVLEQRLLDRITASRPVVMATYEELKADSEAVRGAFADNWSSSSSGACCSCPGDPTRASTHAPERGTRSAGASFGR